MTNPNDPKGPKTLELPDPQAVNNFHRYDDVDNSPDSHHHSLGLGLEQAASGDHSHNGRNSKVLKDYSTTSHTHSELFKQNVRQGRFTGTTSATGILTVTFTPAYTLELSNALVVFGSGSQTLLTSRLFVLDIGVAGNAGVDFFKVQTEVNATAVTVNWIAFGS